MEQLPRDLEGDEGLARAGGEREEDSLLIARDGLHDTFHGDVLIVAAGMRAALVLKWHGGEAVAPCVRLGEGHGPEFVRRGVGGDFAFLPRLHVDAVDAAPVRGIGEAHRQLPRVILRLPHAFGQCFVPRLGFHHAELGVAILQHVIRRERFAAWPPVTFDATGRNRILAPDAAALHHAPSRCLQRGINVLGSGLGFVHGFGRLGVFGAGSFFNPFAACSKSKSTVRGCEANSAP